MTQEFKTASRMLAVKSLKVATSDLTDKGWRKSESWESDVKCVVSYYASFKKESHLGGFLYLTLKKSFSL